MNETTTQTSKSFEKMLTIPAVFHVYDYKRKESITLYEEILIVYPLYLVPILPGLKAFFNNYSNKNIKVYLNYFFLK